MAAPAFDEAFEKVKALAATFKANEPQYLSSNYQEIEARKDFIDKFFIALGWDVNHDRQTNPYAQEAKVERTEGTSQRRADYAFYLAPNFRDVRFYVEAKKPHGDIATPDNYFQAIRYGYGSGNPLAVLTNFQQFHVLDCRYRPDIDKATHRGILKFHYSQYADRETFAKIYWLFSHEAAATGSIEKYAQGLSKPRGKVARRGLFPGEYKPVDESLLEELDEYRKTLARTFKNRNPRLDGETLTEITQRTIDRLVFLRFLEDKQIEVPPLVDEFGKRGTAWEDFIATSRRLDGIYNGVVFKKHDILDAPNFHVDEDAFANICERLSHVNSPYNFDAIPIHILGSIYERFLGGVIVATGKRATVKEKPEARKMRGVYYTPEYIVRYIVENTVGALIAGKSPEQIGEMHFADIACGSGSFLLGVYDLLLEHHGNYYNANPEKARKGDCIERDGKLYLSLVKKREILLKNIYGVDIDAQAVEVCQLSLYLKLLEEETKGTARQYLLEFTHIAQMKKLLPDLSRNIVCGNSLIGRDISEGQLFPGEEERDLNPMNFKDAFPKVMNRGGFDAIVGNPPYVDSEEMTRSNPTLRSYAATNYQVAKGNWDLFCLFLERALKLGRAGGHNALIVPNKLLSADYAEATRNLLAPDLATIRDYSSVNVFAEASVYPVVVITENGRGTHSPITFETMVEENGHVASVSKRLVESGTLKATASGNWAVHFGMGASLIQRLDAACPKLDTVAEVTGAATVSEAYELKRLIRNERKPSSRSIRFINTGTIDRFESLWGRYETTYIKSSYMFPVVDAARLKREFPHRYEQSTKPKLIIAGMTKEIECFIDDSGSFAAGKSTTLVMPGQVNALYLGGLLNSRLMTYFYKETFRSLSLAGGYYRVGPPQMRLLPIVSPKNSDPAFELRHDEVVRKVEAMLEAKKQLAKAKTDKDKSYYENKCASLDYQIDSLVYALYGLSEDEIRIVEAGTEHTSPTTPASRGSQAPETTARLTLGQDS